MIETCPICGGHLYAEEERFGRRFLRVRRLVRCDGCRSIMRQRGNNRWHYAIDPRPNAYLHEMFNGRVFTEPELVELLENPPEKPDISKLEDDEWVLLVDETDVEVSAPLDPGTVELKPLSPPSADQSFESVEEPEDAAPRFIEDDDVEDFFGGE